MFEAVAPESYDEEIRRLQVLKNCPEVFAAIESMAGDSFRKQTELRKTFCAELVRDALTLADLRHRARSKFQFADAMWFNRVGLEQSTPEAVARHKARRFQGRIWDYCCGIGGDAIALAQRGEVIAIDRSGPACLRTTWNAEVYGVVGAIETRCADVLTLQDRDGLLHIDPDRRGQPGERALRIEDYLPDLEQLKRLMSEFAGGAIKLSPASNFGGKFPGCEIELISLAGECKEATVWFGELAGQELFRATVLPQGESLAGHPLQALAPVTPLQSYLYDPDPAVVRAGLVDVLAEQSGLSRLDPAEEYLTGSMKVDSPFLKGFEVLEQTSLRDKDWKEAVKRLQFGQVEIKCRHLPIQADVVRRKLTLQGTVPGVMLFAKMDNRSGCVLARRIAS